MKVLCFGSANIDMVYQVDHVVRPGETENSSALHRYPGGKGLNQCLSLARAGQDTYFAGAIGTDGEDLVQLLAKDGVHTDGVFRRNMPTGNAFIQVSGQAENSIILFHGANYSIEPEDIDSVLKNFTAGDFLVLQNEISSLSYLIDRAYKKGMQVVLNPSPFDEAMRQIDLKKVSYLILNEVEAAGYLNSDRKADKKVDSADPEEFRAYLLRAYPSIHCVLTLGKNGSVYFDANTSVRQEIYPVSAVDTTAAGDTFTGYFITKISEGASPREALRTASMASAIAVSRPGAAPSIPYRNEVEEKLRTWNLRAGGEE